MAYFNEKVTINNATVNLIGSGALLVPAGTSAQRPTPIAGQIRYNSDLVQFEGYQNGAWSTVGGSTELTVTQALHGFVKGDVLYHNGTIFAKAQNDGTLAEAQVIGVVKSAPTTGTFILQASGYISELSGLTAGTQYYLSGTSGAVTATRTVTAGQYPVLIYQAISTTEAMINISGVDYVNVAQSLNSLKTFDTVPTLPVQSANKVFASPVSGASAAPAFRKLVTGDIPSSDNLANVWGDCEAALVTPQARTTLVSTTTRTDTWAYLNGVSDPRVDTSTQLIGTQSIKCLLAVSGEFLETRLFTVPTGYAGKALNVSFLLNTASFTLTTDYTVLVNRYDSTGEWKETLTCQGANFLGIGTWTGFFIAGSSTTDLYSVVIRSNTATDSTIVVDQFYIGQKSLAVGFAGTDEVNVGTTTWNIGTKGTIVADKFWVKYVGDSAEIRVEYRHSGGSPAAGSGTYILSMPTGITIDTTKLTTAGSTGLNTVGYFYATDVTNTVNGTVEIVSATTVYFYPNTTATPWAHTDTVNFGDTDLRFSCFFRVPVVGKSSGITMLNSDRVKSVVNAYRKNSAQTVTTAGAIVIFNQKVTDIKSEYDTSTGIFTAKTGAYYRVIYKVAYTAGTTTTIMEFNITTTPFFYAFGSYYQTDLVATKSYTAVGDAIIYLAAGQSLQVNGVPTGQSIEIMSSGSVTQYSALTIEQLTDRDALAGLPITGKSVISEAQITTVVDTASISNMNNTLFLFNKGSGFTATFLDSAVGNTGKIFRCTNIGAGTVTLDALASENINGATTKTVAQYASLNLISDGSAWYSIF